MIALEIPDDIDQRIVWIEDRLLSNDFDDWLDQQLAVIGDGDEIPIQNDRGGYTVTPDQLDRVASDGLAVLDAGEMESLLHHPMAWKTVRDHVLVHGGDHWTVVSQRRTDDAKMIHRVAGEIASAELPASNAVQPAPGSAWAERGFVAAIAAVATAAVLMVMFQAGESGRTDEGSGIGPVARIGENPKPLPESPEPPDQSGTGELAATQGWGFERFASQIRKSTDQLDPPLDRASYLEQLAQAAESWTAKRPGNSMEVAKRIGEFRMGCSAILMADHDPLPSGDRVWLKEKCHRWAAALDKHLADLESGVEPGIVRGQVDNTVIKIAASLRGRLESAPI